KSWFTLRCEFSNSGPKLSLGQHRRRADGKVSTVKPSDRMTLLRQARSKSSSSTIGTNGAFGMRPPGAPGRTTGGCTDASAAVPSPAPENVAILDVRLPGKSGLDFQRELTETHRAPPIIFITAHGDIPMTVQAMKAAPSSS